MIGNVNVPGALAADIANKVDKISGKGLSTEDYTTAEKNKLAELKNYTGGTGITIDNDGTISCTGGTTVDNSFSTTSENPVQNKVITEAFLELTAVDLPVQSGTLTYDGSSQSPTWTGYDSTKLTLSGTTSGTNAGTYIAKFTPKLPYRWSDSAGREERNVEWTIGRATGTLSLSSTSVDTLKDASTTITLTTNSDGEKSVSSDVTGKVTASVSGMIVTLTGGSTTGSATVTVSIAQSINYTAVSETISVFNVAASSTLANNTPDVIKEIAQTGKAANLWSVGDRTSGISISGTVGSLSINGTYYAFILGFNHNSSIEGTNSIHFCLGMTSDGKRIAFCDSKYGNRIHSSTPTCFNIGWSCSNLGGWNNCRMRNTILPMFKNIIASEWTSIMASVTKYSDNIGGDGNTASNVTSTTDTLFLLSEWEVQGARSYANSKEKDYQAQYSYFANGNGKMFYKHNDIINQCYWWLRSVCVSNRTDFCIVDKGGYAAYSFTDYSYGVVLGFVIK